MVSMNELACSTGDHSAVAPLNVAEALSGKVPERSVARAQSSFEGVLDCLTSTTACAAPPWAPSAATRMDLVMVVVPAATVSSAL